MAEPGVILFGFVNVAALAFGVAGAAPPRKNLDVLAGAALNFSIWVLMLMLQHFFGARAVTSAFFIFDLFLMAGFYLIAHRRPGERSGAVRNRDWASYVFFAYVLIVLIEIAHRALVDSTSLGRIAAMLLGLLMVIFSIIAIRGFGAIGAAATTAAWVFTFLAARYFFLAAINLLTLATLLIVAVKGFGESRLNLRSWSQRLPPERPNDSSRHSRSTLA